MLVPFNVKKKNHRKIDTHILTWYLKHPFPQSPHILHLKWWRNTLRTCESVEPNVPRVCAKQQHGEHMFVKRKGWNEGEGRNMCSIKKRKSVMTKYRRILPLSLGPEVD